MEVQIKESSFLAISHSFKTNDDLYGKLIVDDDLALLQSEHRAERTKKNSEKKSSEIIHGTGGLFV